MANQKCAELFGCRVFRDFSALGDGETETFLDVTTNWSLLSRSLVELKWNKEAFRKKSYT